jgi:uncharacterized protein
VLPVNHRVVDGTVVFRSNPGAKLGAAASAATLTVQADRYDQTGEVGWSVLVRGTADIVTDPDLLSRLDTLGLEPWAEPDRRDFWIRVAPTQVTGRRLAAPD